MCESMNCNDCRNELNLCKLCSKKAKIECLCACSIISKKVCSESLKAVRAEIESETVNDLCVSGDLNATSVYSLDSSTNHLCAQSGVIGTLCVNDLTVGTIKNCVKYRAAASLSADTVYALGSNIDWDVILDDPNGNVSVAPFSYTVPVSGYYQMSFYLRSDSLTGASIIGGLPVGVMDITANGTDLRQLLVPYLSFASTQVGVLSALVLLNAGDIVRMRYNVLVLDPNTGLTNYAGTVSIKGTSAAGFSQFEIHYLSSLDCIPGQICTPCEPVTIPCEPVSVMCDANQSCFPGKTVEEPCDSCQ